MADLTKLRELQEQASPHWTVDEFGSPTWHVYSEIKRDETIGYALFGRASNNTFPRIAWFHSHGEGVDSRANAKLAALATHLLPIAEALEEAQTVMRHYVDHVRSHQLADADATAMEMLLGERVEGDSDPDTNNWPSIRKALTKLQEALDE